MAQQHLNQLIKSLVDANRVGSENPVIGSIAFDSRNVEEGGIFFALKGIHTDGHHYIQEALDAGASAVVHSDPVTKHRPGIVYLQVADTRAALSPFSAAFWGHPSRNLKVVGVTGTDGKSTTVGLVRQLLEFTGARAGSVSTVSFNIGNRSESNPLRQSTPEASQIHGLLRAMLDAEQEYAVLEATSHALSPRNSRLADVEFDAAVFTNVTSEHLEFHGNIETYRADKTRLFEAVAASQSQDAFGVVNADDPHAELFITAAGEKPVFTYSLRDEDADLFATNIASHPSGTSFTLVTPTGRNDVRINLPGVHNVENVLAALCVVAELQDEDPLDLSDRCPELMGVEGRMETVAGDMDFHVMVDYAHTPGSFTKVLPFLKRLAEDRLIVVFGSAGERDQDKRPKQGRLASKYADIIFLTDEDPRGEDSMDILEEIARGVEGLERGEGLFLIPDRGEAIREAFKTARAGDLVAILGKGHEGSIIYADGPCPWDDMAVCREALRELGY